MTRWLNHVSIFGHLQQWKLAQKCNKFTKVGLLFCQIRNKLPKSCKRLENFAIVAKFHQIWSHWSKAFHLELFECERNSSSELKASVPLDHHPRHIIDLSFLYKIAPLMKSHKNDLTMFIHSFQIRTKVWKMFCTNSKMEASSTHTTWTG